MRSLKTSILCHFRKNRNYSKIPRPNISVKWNLTRPGFPYVFDHSPIFITENFRNIRKNETILIMNLHFYLRFSKEINGIFKNKYFLPFPDISMISDKFDQKLKNRSLSFPTRFLHKIDHFLEILTYCEEIFDFYQKSMISIAGRKSRLDYYWWNY